MAESKVVLIPTYGMAIVSERLFYVVQLLPENNNFTASGYRTRIDNRIVVRHCYLSNITTEKTIIEWYLDTYKSVNHYTNPLYYPQVCYGFNNVPELVATVRGFKLLE